MLLWRIYVACNNTHSKSSCTLYGIFVQFSPNLSFLARFSQKHAMPNLTEMRAVGVALMHGDGQTNMMTLVGPFLQVCERA